MNLKKVLYMSYDGMTDPLGQSQVIPYLEGLSKEGFKITLLSCEKTAPYQKYKADIAEQLREAGIKWETIRYSKSPPVISTLYDIVKLRKKATALHKEEKFHIVHCRSYITAFVGLWMKRRFGTRFIFDMRGFWADERVEGGLWDMKNPLYKIIYAFFKEKEKQFLSEADHIISLTFKAKSIISSRKDISGQPLPVTVIPCCVDTEHFNPEKVDIREKEKNQQVLGIKPEDKILAYLGSLGTWYMLDEMLLFFQVLLKNQPEYKFLFITKDNPLLIEEKARKMGIPKEKIVITSSGRKELPSLLSVCDIAISFILPSFSKSASSPTKLGELLSMGIPVFCNKGVGDVDFLLRGEFSSLLLEETCISAFIEEGGINRIVSDKGKYRTLSTTHFSLLKGIKSYSDIYKQAKHV